MRAGKGYPNRGQEGALGPFPDIPSRALSGHHLLYHVWTPPLSPCSHTTSWSMYGHAFSAYVRWCPDIPSGTVSRQLFLARIWTPPLGLFVDTPSCPMFGHTLSALVETPPFGPCTDTPGSGRLGAKRGYSERGQDGVSVRGCLQKGRDGVSVHGTRRGVQAKAERGCPDRGQEGVSRADMGQEVACGQWPRGGVRIWAKR